MSRNGSGNYGGGAGGGGSLELVAVGSLIMSGTLDVSGGTGGNGDEPGGAGSGGGLILSAPSLDVTGGSILADGGDGGDGNGGWSYGGGGGGGGRVLFAAGSVTGLVDGVTVDVTGGLGGSRTNNASVGQPGLDGTFLLELEVAQPIPEPAGLAMIGFALLGLKRRKRNRGAERSCVMGKRMLGWIAVVGLAVALVAPAAFAVGHDVTADETETGTQTYDYLKWPSANTAVYTYTVSGAGDVTVGTGTATDIEFEHGGTLTVTGGGQVSVPTAGGDLRTNTTDTNTVTINVLGTAAGPASLDIADYLYHNDDRRAKPLEVTVGGTSATNKGTLNMGKLYIERGSSEAAQAICNFTIQNHGEMTVDSGAYGQNDVVFDNLTTTTFTVDTGGALTFGQSDYAGTMGNVTFDVSGTFDLCDSDADPGLYPQLYAGNARQDQRLWLKIRDGGVTRVSLNNTRTTGLAGALLLRKQEARNAMAGIQMYGSSTLEIGRTLRFGTAAEPYLADEGDMFYFEDDSTVHFKCQNRWTDGDDRYEDSHHLTLYIAPQDLGRAADGWGTGPNGSGNFSMGNLVIEPNVNGDADVDFDLAVNGMTTPGLLYIETLKFVPGDVAGEEIRMDLKGDTLYVHDGVDLDGDGSWDITNSGPLALSATNWAAVGGIGSYSDYFLDGIGGGAVYVGELTVEPIPEPAGLGLIGLAMLGLTRRRR